VAAGIHASVPVACLRAPAVVGLGALPRGARHQCVADEAMRAGAHRPVITSLVVARCTRGACAAWVRFAQISFSKQSAAFEGMTRVVLGTAADGLVVVHATESVGATGSAGGQLRTGVLAAVLNTGEGRGAIVVFYTLRSATTGAVRVTQEILGTGAPTNAICYPADGARSARIRRAQVHASVVLARRVGTSTVLVHDTLMAAAGTGQGVANKVGFAGTLGLVVPHIAVGVRPAGVGVADSLCAGNEGVTKSAAGT